MNQIPISLKDYEGDDLFPEHLEGYISGFINKINDVLYKDYLSENYILEHSYSEYNDGPLFEFVLKKVTKMYIEAGWLASYEKSGRLYKIIISHPKTILM